MVRITIGILSTNAASPECCKQIAVFTVTSDPSRSYLNNTSTNQWHIVAFQQGHNSLWVMENLQDNFANTAGTDLKLSCNSISPLLKGGLQFMASLMQELLTLEIWELQIPSLLAVMQSSFCNPLTCFALLNPLSKVQPKQPFKMTYFPKHLNSQFCLKYWQHSEK